MILSTFVQIKKHTSEVAITHIAMDRSFFFFFFFLFTKCRNPNPEEPNKQTNKNSRQNKTPGGYQGGPSDPKHPKTRPLMWIPV